MIKRNFRGDQRIMTKTVFHIKEGKADRLYELFTIALKPYDFNPHTKIRIKRTKLKGSTMQAQPIFSLKSLLRGLRAYRIRVSEYVRGSDSLKVDELPEDVLIGWFAHELGHVKDYQDHSLIGMLIFGLKYVLSARFRKKIEHRADQIAIEHGFHNEVLATKKFLFHHEAIENSYRLKMKRFYMPMRDVEDWIEENISIDPVD